LPKNFWFVSIECTMDESISTLHQLVSLLPKEMDAQALLEEIEKQVRKDLYSANYNSQQISTPEDLLHAVKSCIAPLYEKHRERFMQLMYRVDISEKMLKPVIANAQSVNDALDRISLMIIYRCFQKVMSRKYFR